MGYQRKSCEVGYGRIDRIVSFLRWLGTMYSKPPIFMQVCVTVGKKLNICLLNNRKIDRNDQDRLLKKVNFLIKM